jgi:RimJ/RimL family protein N-acetyltransferase
MTDLAFAPLDDLSALHICRHMRAVDAEEIFAMRPDHDAFALYRDIMGAGPRHLWLEAARPATALQPVALFGVIATSPGCGLAHLIGTDDLDGFQAREIVWRIRNVMIPAMIAEGLHRVEANSLATHRWAHRFLKASGARAEGQRRRAMGKMGEDFQTFVWIKDELPPALNPDHPAHATPAP